VEEVNESVVEYSHDIIFSKIKNHDCHDRKTLKKKLKKVKRMMAATNDAKELEMYKQKQREYKMALETLKKQEINVEIPPPSRHSQHELLEEDGKLAPIEGDDSGLSPSYSLDSDPRCDKMSYEENGDQIELLQKKLRKADKSIAKARKEDDPKKLKKIEKKRLEYQTSLVGLLSNR